MMKLTADDEKHFVRDAKGIFIPKVAVKHRDEEYSESGFDSLREMQTRHFWYCGRHRFLLYALKRMLGRRRQSSDDALSMIDLGGGCGGWINYLTTHANNTNWELALADSSVCALEYAEDFTGPSVKRFQVDMLQLPWKERWDVVFLLDVLEHIPDHIAALKQAYQILRPGGLLFVTTPALQFFWTYNDDLAHHVRRYSRNDFAALADATGFELCTSRYFMFLLSPLLYLSRLKSPDLRNMNADDIQALLHQTHRVPSSPVNAVLRSVFNLETPAGFWMPFPWSTSILGVFQKKNQAVCP
ncbi:class I SAM-dependent methyltransferase [uncultured Gimesia sp.]|jgi:SAM-dependent methyltransferase|uniref:class I SAM-dependent methyltransferase n=1 Tax=uncultured Gimesia sp. TaxID=1678688 RepID=UPI002625FD0E|nr:class I SAM-dependent methyltransferase [uncultured Gimesia sp.]